MSHYIIIDIQRIENILGSVTVRHVRPSADHNVDYKNLSHVLSSRATQTNVGDLIYK